MSIFFLVGRHITSYNIAAAHDLDSSTGVSNSNRLEGHIAKKNAPRAAFKGEKAFAGHNLQEKLSK
jgi:hypothetical protein